MAAVMDFEKTGVSMDTGNMLDKLIVEQEQQLENAQHRLVVELAQNRLGVLREMQRRILVDHSLMRCIPSEAARLAVDDVFHDFEVRVQGLFGGMDELTQKLIAAHADREEYEEAYERAVHLGMEMERKWFSGKKAAVQYKAAAEAARGMADSSDRVLQLRKEMRSKEQALKQGQEKILGLIEEFIDRYQGKQIKAVAGKEAGSGQDDSVETEPHVAVS
jgi:hypothetical protein